MKTYCPSQQRFPYVPLGIGASVVVLGNLIVDTRPVDPDGQLLLSKEFEPKQLAHLEYMKTFVRIRSINGKNVYLVHPDDLLGDEERWRGCRACCRECKRACNEKPVKDSKTNRREAAIRRVENFLLTQAGGKNNVPDVEAAVRNHMRYLGSLGGRKSSPKKRVSARLAALARWRMRKLNSESNCAMPSDGKVAQ
jgi:hypothetical protein